MNIRNGLVREYAGGTSGGGILRKTGNTTVGISGSATCALNGEGVIGGPFHGHHEARQMDLLIFGYACKIFRDDERAREIDQGKHLIPWMNDANLKIDRYDVRGALFDLTPHEAPFGGYGNRLDYLSSEEQRAELLCEEERYFYLYNNEEEHILQQEEDLKRLKQETGVNIYNQVDFQYRNISAAIDKNEPEKHEQEQQKNQVNDLDEHQLFTLPQNFKVPADIQLPETMKQHIIIEKTARFIADQGAQMEILLKAKQSNNVQFEFLAQKSNLNPYYKHILQAIKQGIYPETKCKDNDKNTQTGATISNAEAKVFGYQCFEARQKKKPAILVPTIRYKPSANCAYTQLISKIKGVPLQTVIDEDTNSNHSDFNSSAASIKSNGSEFTPVLVQYNGSTFTHAMPTENAAGDDGGGDGDGDGGGGGGGDNETDNADSKTKVEVIKNTSALLLAQNYYSDTDTNDEDDNCDNVEQTKKAMVNLNFPIPEENLRHIIDKTVTYVIKNGRQFEETLRIKSVERFSFLLPGNEYYPYYLYKITGDPNAASAEEKARKAAAVAALLLSRKGLTNSNAVTDPQETTISFSIKSKDEQQNSNLQPALPQEASDEDESNIIVGDRQVPERVQKAIKLVEAQLMARNNSQQHLHQQQKHHHQQLQLWPSDVDNSESQGHQQVPKKDEKIKDKLAQIAREKLGGLLTKDKQLQLERKRKAMAFLNQIKGDVISTTSSIPKNEIRTQSTQDTDELIGRDSEDSSVRSIPITSYGPDDVNNTDEEFEKNQIKNINNFARKRSKTVLLSNDDNDVQLVCETCTVVKCANNTDKKSSSNGRHRTHKSAYSRRKYDHEFMRQSKDEQEYKRIKKYEWEREDSVRELEHSSKRGREYARKRIFIRRRDRKRDNEREHDHEQKVLHEQLHQRFGSYNQSKKHKSKKHRKQPKCNERRNSVTPSRHSPSKIKHYTDIETSDSDPSMYSATTSASESLCKHTHKSHKKCRNHGGSKQKRKYRKPSSDEEKDKSAGAKKSRKRREHSRTQSPSRNHKIRDINYDYDREYRSQRSLI